MVLQLDDKWIWDSWYAHDGTRWHGYFLQADKTLGDPDLRHFNVTQGHAVSDDLSNWTHLGTCFAPSEGPAWDDFTTWTGSVVRDEEGLWHLFYTGSSRAEDGLYQRVGHATSEDMHTWVRVGDGLCLDLTGPNAPQYETAHMLGHWHDRAMRDPWVMKDPGGDGWLMYFTARHPDVAEPNAGGTVGFATSPDLIHWELQPPIVAPGTYGQLEVPQVFEVEGTWYCLFCTAAQHWSEALVATGERPVTGNHYLVSDSPRGPFRLPDGPFLDGDVPCYRYAARILKTPLLEAGDGLVILGFADGGRENFGGYVHDPAPVWRNPDGTLTLTPPGGASGD